MTHRIGWALLVGVVAVGCWERPRQESRPAPAHLDLELALADGPVELTLERNDHLASPELVQRVIEQGQLRAPRAGELKAPRTDCYYQGRARRGGASGVAALSTCEEGGALRGMVQLGEDWLLLEPRADGRSEVTRARGTAREALGPVGFSTRAAGPHSSARAALSTPTKFAEALAVSDHHSYAIDRDQTTQRVLDAVNGADALLRNGQLSPVVGLTVTGHIAFLGNEPWPSPDLIDAAATLSAFTIWADDGGAPFRRDVDYLFTGADMAFTYPDGGIETTAVTGLAWTSGMCSRNSAAMMEARDPSLGYRSVIAAHETGHTFSLQHDASSGYIMAASAGPASLPTTWSSQSISQWSSFFANIYGHSTNPACLENTPPSGFGSVCGDGEVGPGEQCDCGSSDCRYIDPCCDGATCQFVAGAQCSNRDACCSNTCQLRPSGTSCRAATACVQSASCDGIHSTCPDERYQPPGTACQVPDDSQASQPGACYYADCASWAAQCANVGLTNYGSPWYPCTGALPSDVCSNLYCNDTPNQACSTHFFVSPPDGMTCGTGKQCASGACVASSTIVYDYCPSDPAKTDPGACGCGQPDTDTDHDGTPDCVDGCPSDTAKVAPGTCGCGTPDVDTDHDGTLDCLDGCPTDPTKTAPGACGCGVSDVDSDHDGTPDCLDACPNDPTATTLPCPAPDAGQAGTSTSSTGSTSSTASASGSTSAGSTGTGSTAGSSASTSSAGSTSASSTGSTGTTTTGAGSTGAVSTSSSATSTASSSTSATGSTTGSTATASTSASSSSASSTGSGSTSGSSTASTSGGTGATSSSSGTATGTTGTTGAASTSGSSTTGHSTSTSSGSSGSGSSGSTTGRASSASTATSGSSGSSGSTGQSGDAAKRGCACASGSDMASLLGLLGALGLRGRRRR